MGFIGPLAAPLLIGSSVHTQEQQRREQRRALRQQEQAQTIALSTATRAQRLADETQRAANRKKPDVAAILANAQSASMRGPTSTILSGIEGVDRKKLRLGESSLLGE